MTNLNEINQHYPLVIRTITPLHIGGPQEKHLIQGLDFIEEKGAVYLLDYIKIFELVQPHIISEYLSGARNGGVLSGLKQQGINLKDVSFRVIPNVQVVGDIKTFVKNPIQNKPYIPGSSLKGAIRSIVLGALVPKDKSFKDNRAMEIEILGKFETDIFRHIKFSDGQADRLEYFTAKIFNLHSISENKWLGGWKHGSNNTNNHFRRDGFVSSFECIPGGVDIVLDLKITKVNSNFWKNILNKKMVNDNYKKVLTENPWKDLCSLINTHTRKYINKELAFLDKYPVRETPQITEMYQKILALIPEDSAYAVFRMAHGSGYHSITGDWQFADFDKTGYKNNKKLYKSRKFIFNEGQNGLQFLTMGFLIMGSAANIPEIELAFKEYSDTMPVISLGTDITIPEDKKVEPTFYTGKIKTDIQLDAVVVQTGKPNLLEVYLNEPNKVQLPLLGYASERPIGEIMRVTVLEMDKSTGNPKRIKFFSYKK